MWEDAGAVGFGVAFPAVFFLIAALSFMEVETGVQRSRSGPASA